MNRVLPVTVLVVSALTALTQHAVAQTADRDNGRGRFGANVGVVSYQTGNDRNCSTGVGVAGGVEVRSRGSLLLAAGADVIAATPFACASALQMTTYQGQEVGVNSGVQFPFAPRTGVRVGWSAPAVEAALRAGYLVAQNDFSDDKWSARPVLGGDVAWYPTGRVGVQFVYEQFQVPTRYSRDRQLVHEFNRWKPIYRLGIVF